MRSSIDINKLEIINLYSKLEKQQLQISD